MSSGSSWGTFKRLAGSSRRYSGWYLVIGVLCVSSAVANVARVEGLRKIIDAATGRNPAEMWLGLAYGLGAFAVGAVGDISRDYLQARLDQYTSMDLQISLVKKVQRLSQAFIDKNHSGDIIARILENTGTAQSGINRTFIGVIQNVLNVSLLIGYLIHLNWQLTVGTIVASLAIPAALVPLSGFQKRIWADTWKIEGDLSAFVQDSVQGGEITRTYGLAPKFRRRFKERYAALMSKLLKAECWNQSTNITIWALLIGGIFFVLGYGGTLVAKGLTTLGAVTAFLCSFEQISFPISSIVQAWPSLQKSLGAADRVFELMDAPEQSEGWGEGDIMPEELENRPVRFQHIHFGYDGGSPVLSDLNFTAEAGKVTAVVGESGSGKSTLLKLLLGMYLPSGGHISVGETPITDYSLDSWRSCLGYVSQDVCLFNGSIRRNIGMGSDGAKNDEIVEAAAAAHCDEFIEGLPQGYDTQIGEKGLMLSGGQRQRIAIARAVLKRPGLLLLDEATSALDNESERLVQDALERFCKGRTTIVVAHRLSTVMGADKIVFLEGGRVAEEGTHEELMNLRGRYYMMFTAAYGERGGVAV